MGLKTNQLSAELRQIGWTCKPTNYATLGVAVTGVCVLAWIPLKESAAALLPLLLSGCQRPCLPFLDHHVYQ